MSFSTKHTLSKITLGCSLAVAVFITGCNDKTSTETVVSSQDELVMTTITLDTVDQILFVPLLTNSDLTQEQVTCLEARDQDLGKAEVDAFYKSKFTNDELASLNKFYASEVGQKLLAFGNEQLLIMNGQQTATPMPGPTEEEMAQIQTFMQSPLGAKYTEVNNTKGEGSAMDVINKSVNAEFKRCNIDIEL